MESISEIKERLATASNEQLPELIALYKNDPRSGVLKLAESFEKKLAALQKERDRMYEMFHYERLYPEVNYIGGIDEVGSRTRTAGRACICRCGHSSEGLRHSLLNRQQTGSREEKGRTV